MLLAKCSAQAAQWLLVLLLLPACVTRPDPLERDRSADTLAAAQHWHAQTIVAGDFSLRTYLPQRIETAAQLTVYIEGDGLVWISSSLPSGDPTPRRPLALQLALAQPQANAAYLARPCQYHAAPQMDAPCAIGPRTVSPRK